MKNLSFILLAGLGGIALNWLSLLAGWWWITPIIGLLLGLCIYKAGVSLVLSLCVGGAGWGLPLALLATHAPVSKVASVVESVIGLTSTNGILIIILTIVLGCMLSLVGTWVGIAGKAALQ